MSHTFDHTQYKDEVEQRWGAPGTLWARSGHARGRSLRQTWHPCTRVTSGRT